MTQPARRGASGLSALIGLSASRLMGLMMQCAVVTRQLSCRKMYLNTCLNNKVPTLQGSADLAIVGGGAAAVAVASRLARSAKINHSFLLDIFETSGDVGPGRAYRTPSSSHLMNTAHRHCSIVSGDAAHLERWLADGGRPRPLYLARPVYGEYLRAAKAEASQLLAASKGMLSVHKVAIVEIDRGGVEEGGLDDFVLRADNGAEFRAKRVVLALGDPPPAPVPAVDGPIYHPSPWPFENLNSIRSDASVAIAGAGASAIDCCLYLVQERAHEGSIQVWTRSGQLPCVQRDPSLPCVDVPRVALDALVDSGSGPFSLVEIKDAIDRDLAAMFGDRQVRGALTGRASADAVERLRAQIVAAEAGTPSHQDYVRGLRDLAPVLWRRLSAEDQRIFDEQYYSLWNRYKHPVALGVARPFLKLIDEGKVTIMRGTPAGQGDGAQVVINASGQDFNVERSESPLLRSILDRGLGVPHPRGGLRVDDALRVHGPRGATQGLYALGALTRGEHFAVASIHALVGASERLCSHLEAEATASPADAFL